VVRREGEGTVEGREGEVPRSKFKHNKEKKICDTQHEKATPVACGFKVSSITTHQRRARAAEQQRFCPPVLCGNTYKTMSGMLLSPSSHLTTGNWAV
jgi:hypothetical protein